MIDYTTWNERLLSVQHTKLDDQNPRLPHDLMGELDQRELAHYLYEHENVIELIESILQTGYMPNSAPIVIKEGERHVVLEGNRRLTACKLITNPDMAPPNRKKYLKNLIKQYPDRSREVAKINMLRAPDRFNASVYINSRHTNPQIKKWSPLSKARFYYDHYDSGHEIEEIVERFSNPKIPKWINLYLVYDKVRQLLKNDSDSYEKIIDETKFNVTNLQRFYDFPAGASFLGIKFNKPVGFYITIPEDEFNKRLIYITKEIIGGNITSRKVMLNNDTTGEHIENFLYETGRFRNLENEEVHETLSIKKAENRNKKTNNRPDPINKNRSKKKERIKIIPEDLVSNLNTPPRIDDIFLELQSKLSINTTPNAVAIVFRSFLEMIVHQYFISNKLNEEYFKQEYNRKANWYDKIHKRISEYINTHENVDSINIEELLKKIDVKKGAINKNYVPSLREMLMFISKSEETTLETKLKKVITSHLDKKSQTNHLDLNSFVHNEYEASPTKSELLSLWNKFDPLIREILSTLDNDSDKL